MGKQALSVFSACSLALVLLSLVGCETATRHRASSIPSEPTKFSSRDLASNPAPETQLLKKLMWPVTHHKVTQEFHDESEGKPHDGIDISSPKGARIYAPADGRVVYAGQKFHGYGKMIVIEHNGGLATIYGHCQKLLVKSGELVHRGSLIGLVGRTGHASAPHLHFEVRLDKLPVDPLGYLP